MVSHELSQLQDRLAKYKREQDTFRKAKKVNANSIAVDQKIDRIKNQINELGAKGRLIMALIIAKEPVMREDGIPKDKIFTYTILFHDLDDYSIYKLLTAYYGDRAISKSLIEIPLKTPVPASLNDKFISWQINP